MVPLGDAQENEGVLVEVPGDGQLAGCRLEHEGAGQVAHRLLEFTSFKLQPKAGSCDTTAAK